MAQSSVQTQLRSLDDNHSGEFHERSMISEAKSTFSLCHLVCSLPVVWLHWNALHFVHCVFFPHHSASNVVQLSSVLDAVLPVVSPPFLLRPLSRLPAIIKTVYVPISTNSLRFACVSTALSYHVFLLILVRLVRVLGR